MVVHKDADQGSTEKSHIKDGSTGSRIESPLIHDSFGKPGDALPSVLRTGNSSRQNELAMGSKLDIPSLWSNSSGRLLEQGRANNNGGESRAESKKLGNIGSELKFDL